MTRRPTEQTVSFATYASRVSPAFKMSSQRFPRVRLSAPGDGLRRASDNQTSPLVSAFRPKVEDAISTFDNIKVVFDHQH